MTAYLCLDCEVIGRGDVCWSCLRSDNLLRSGPRVDGVVYGLETRESVQHARAEA